MTDCVNALKQWTGKASATIIYDSTVDEFTGEWVFNNVKGKPNIAVVGFTTNGDVFGVFYNVTVTQQHGRFYDPNMFIFSFESHGRCMTPQRFVVEKRLKEFARVEFFKNDSLEQVVGFHGYAGGGFVLGNEKSKTYCNNLSFAFEGIKDTTLTGNNFPKKFICCRIVAIQLE